MQDMREGRRALKEREKPKSIVGGMPGYRVGELTVKCIRHDMLVTVPKHGDVTDKCVICHDELPNPASLLLQHRVDGIQVYSVCGKSSCWERLGEKMAEGKR